MRLTRFTEYALRVLNFVAGSPDQKATVQQIADACGISRNHLMKVAQRLGRAGLLRPSRGRAGGLVLARPAKDIDVGEVIRACEPELPLGCIAGEQCSLSGRCRLPPVLQEALAAFLETASRHSLAELLTDDDGVAGTGGGAC